MILPARGATTATSDVGVIFIATINRYLINILGVYINEYKECPEKSTSLIEF